MTRGGSPSIPLGYLLEGVWDDSTRWLGLVGRTKLTPAELQAVNLTTWPDLAEPFQFLSDQFDNGWAADWGDAGLALEKAWARSAMAVEVSDATALLNSIEIDFAVRQQDTVQLLLGKLSMFIPRLAPIIAAQVIPLRREMPIELVDELGGRMAA
jgi:hypothetical protein